MSLLTKYKQVTDHSGINWYRESHSWACAVAEKYSLSLVAVCGVISALSPGTNWEANKRDTIALITKRQGHKCTTYGSNVLKARAILKDGIPRFSAKTGSKTYNFFHNLLEPDNSAFVTIDRHAYLIATGDTYTSGLYTAKYNKIAAQYRQAAKRLGLLPNELQAVLWCDYRIKQNIKFNIPDTPF